MTAVAERAPESGTPHARASVPPRYGDPEAVPRSKWTALSALTDGDRWKGLGDRARQMDLVANPPASLADLVAHAQGGSRADWLYGWLLAIPASAGLYFAAWEIQRRGRLLALVTIVALLALAT